VGDGSLLVPGAGDASDLLWAPLSAVLVRLLYGSNTLAAVNFLEELLPFTVRVVVLVVVAGGEWKECVF
jgi:hypothetical protein